MISLNTFKLLGMNKNSLLGMFSSKMSIKKSDGISNEGPSYLTFASNVKDCTILGIRL
jgi:hypothetical protein